jgi:hypothetical protein
VANHLAFTFRELVGMIGFEPMISSTQNWRITKLSYIPMRSSRWVPFGTHPGIL